MPCDKNKMGKGYMAGKAMMKSDTKSTKAKAVGSKQKGKKK